MYGWWVALLNLLGMGGGPVVDTTAPAGAWRRARQSWDRVWKRSWLRVWQRDRQSWRRVWRAYKVASSIQAETLVKTVSEVRDFAVDVGSSGELAGGLTISSATNASVSGLTIGSWSVLASAFDGIAAGDGVSAQFSGGTAGTTYSFGVLVTLSNSRVITVPCKLKVVADTGS